ncbi:MAG: sensor histidine kinase [Solirubrobacteraceae bacterium]
MGGPSWLRRPAPTVRLRLTALYGTVFLFTGAALLTFGYLFVRDNLVARPRLRDEALARLGIHPYYRYPFDFPIGSRYAGLVHATETQILSGALHRLLVEYAIGLFAMTAISVVTGWLLAGRALAPLRRITATARRVSGENLGERIALRGPADELRELADTFDGMLERLDGAFASQRHFVANASHELRTPLAIMRTEIDVALADPDAGVQDLRETGEAVREMVDRCERLIASLLLLARSEVAARHAEPVDVASLVADCITDLWARAQESRIEVRDSLAPAWCSGDPGLLERLIANLIDNAIHHNEPGGFLDVQTRTVAGRVELVVVNGGRMIDPVCVRELAEPFRRLDRSVRGFGLGLSIVRTIAIAHGGELVLDARPSGGLRVRVTLPGLARAGHSDARGSGGAARIGAAPAVRGSDAAAAAR